MQKQRISSDDNSALATLRERLLMTGWQDCREKINEIDEQMVRLFEERMEVSAEIAKYKKENRLPIYDGARERSKLEAVNEQLPEHLRDYGLSLYSLLMDLSKTYQHRTLGESSEVSERIEQAIRNTPPLFPEKAVVACQGVEGAFRFLGRVWRILGRFEETIRNAPKEYDVSALTKEEKDLRRVLHMTIRKVTEDVRDRFMFNTAISSIMELVNAFYAFQDKEINAGLARELADALLRMLAPFAPHITEELWSILFAEGSVHRQKWPVYDEAATVQDEIEIVLQINGKVRDKLSVPADVDRAAMEKIAMEQPRVQELTAGKTVVKVICVPKKLVNIVVK